MSDDTPKRGKIRIATLESIHLYQDENGKVSSTSEIEEIFMEVEFPYYCADGSIYIEEGVRLRGISPDELAFLRHQMNGNKQADD